MADLKGKVVVVTGASSGIGRAAAIEFARQGSDVVLAARRREALEQTARECRDAGSRALTVVADVTKEEDVARVIDGALERWGRIDVWVNNAGVTLFARLDEGPFEEHRRVIETNVFGAMLCARAVMPVFRRQREGVLIDVGSILSKVGQPFVPSYVISKFALRGLSEALRSEFADEPNVHVCTVFPYAVDTPHFQSGANRVGREARAMPPAQKPEKVARAIVQVARRPRRERHVPRWMAFGLLAHALFPGWTERLLLQALRRWHFSDAPEPETTGNLYEPPASGEAAEVHGTRPPQIGAPRFAAWAVRNAFKLPARAVERRVRSWSARSTTS